MCRYVKILNEAFLIVCVTISMASCDAEHERQQNGLDVQLPPLQASLVEECHEQVLLLGQTCSPVGGSPVRVRLRQISQDKGSCMLEVENKNTGTISSGWVRANGFVEFADREFGKKGLQVTRLLTDRDRKSVV